MWSSTCFLSTTFDIIQALILIPFTFWWDAPPPPPHCRINDILYNYIKTQMRARIITSGDAFEADDVSTQTQKPSLISPRSETELELVMAVNKYQTPSSGTSILLGYNSRSRYNCSGECVTHTVYIYCIYNFWLSPNGRYCFSWQPQAQLSSLLSPPSLFALLPCTFAPVTPDFPSRGSYIVGLSQSV